MTMMRKDDNLFEVPFQLQALLNSLKDQNEKVHVRGNYRMRLEGIKHVIDKALMEYDLEMGKAPAQQKFKKVRQ